MINPDTLEALHRSRSIDLYHLSLVLDRLLSDPRRILEVRTRLHVGQAVRFVDHRANTPELTLRTGRVTDLQDRHAVVRDDALRQHWKLPYVAIEAESAGAADPAVEQPPQPAPRPSRESFRVGDRVSFDDRHLQPRIGTITRVNERTATIDCDGQRWRVSFQLLRQVRDICP